MTASDSLNQHGSGGWSISLREVLLGMIAEHARHMVTSTCCANGSTGARFRISGSTQAPSITAPQAGEVYFTECQQLGALAL